MHELQANDCVSPHWLRVSFNSSAICLYLKCCESHLSLHRFASPRIISYLFVGANLFELWSVCVPSTDWHCWIYLLLQANAAWTNNLCNKPVQCKKDKKKRKTNTYDCCVFWHCFLAIGSWHPKAVYTKFWWIYWD